MKVLPLAFSLLMLTGLPTLAQQLALAPGRPDCGADEPDPVQISWDAPCDQGNWLKEPSVGCRMPDWHPDPQDRATWSGACIGALKHGKGIAQWTEHGEFIDRFEGTYRKGKREGQGRYIWSRSDRFDGNYANDVPNGLGTVTIAGTTFTGEWRNGCLIAGDKVVAIGVARHTCEGDGVAVGETAARD